MPHRVFVVALAGGPGISARSSHYSKPPASKHFLRKTIVDSGAHRVRLLFYPSLLAIPALSGTCPSLKGQNDAARQQKYRFLTFLGNFYQSLSDVKRDLFRAR
jgi:hypothetical protein